MIVRRCGASLAITVTLLLAGCGRLGIDQRDEHGMTALMVAARDGRLDQVERLIAKGANVNAAVPTRDLRELIAFISWMQELPKSDIGYTPLMYAAQGGHLDVAQLLIRKGANVNAATRDNDTALT